MRGGFVALIGQPNVGKSSLVNALVGEKVSIVNRKPQTTRKRIKGVYTTDEAQIVFVDAPGLVRAKSGLNRFLSMEFNEALAEVDVIIAVLGADDLRREKVEEILQLVKSTGKPHLVVLNKADLLSAQKVAMPEWMAEVGIEILPISALKLSLEKRAVFLEKLLNFLPEIEAPFFDTEIYTTQTLRELASEVIREKCFEYLHEEIPYGLAVKIDKFDESRKDLLRIYATVLVNKESHKGMVIGQGGQMLKTIGSLARVELEKTFQSRIFLDLHVKCKPGWAEDDSAMKDLDYVAGS